MEKIRHKRYKIASNVDRSSGERFSPVKRGIRAGNRKNEKQRNLPRLASDSSSCSSGATGEDSFTLDLGWRSSTEYFGAPVKKLLAYEMSKETEIKKRSPNVIAKLMGLDGMPPPRSAYNQQKCPSEDYSQRCISKEKVERRGSYCDVQMTRRSRKHQQEFKDVFEVLETSKTEQSRNSDQGTAKFEVTGSEMAFIRQKFMDAKRLSTDEKLHDSREFHDALDALESNRDLLLKFLHQPGSLFARHLNDLQDDGCYSGRDCLTAMESLGNRKCDYPVFRGNSERGTPQKNSSKSNYNHRGGPSSHSDSSFSGHLSKSSQILERKNELEHLPTRIVVLKPNIGKVQNARNIIYPSHSFPKCSDLGEFRTVERRTKNESRGKKEFLDKVLLSRQSYKESRDVADGKNRQIRNGLSTPPMNLTCSGFQGYAGDESSCSLSGNESAEEPMVRTVNLKGSSSSNAGYRRSSSRHKESSISREAKKRLTARWRSTRNSEDKGVVSRGSTLADMLSAHDKEVTLADLDARITEEGFTDKFSNDEQPGREVEPLGISSNDGWKDACRHLTRPRSLPKGTNKHLISKESKRENNKAVTNNFDQRERLVSQKSKSYEITQECSQPSSRESNDMLLPIQVNPDSLNTHSLDDSSSKMTFTEFEASCSNVDDRSPISQSVENVRDAYTITFPETHEVELQLESSDCMSAIGNSCFDDRDNITHEEGPSVESPAPSHKSVAVLESPASSKEADQPSPVSVLEPAFGDDLSSCSECFESVSTDLQGLRMQLQLLKLDSEAFTEGPMLTSSDEDAAEVSAALRDENGHCRAKDSWEFSYLLDILTDSGLNDANPGTLLATLFSSDCPINPKLFEQLEKKQSCPSSSTSQPDRRLLFDRINSGLLAISLQLSDPHPWVRPVKTQIATKWMKKNELQNRLCKFLDTQLVRYDVVEEESEWQDFGDEIDVIGKEIERLMIDELLAEVVTEFSFFLLFLNV